MNIVDGEVSLKVKSWVFVWVTLMWLTLILAICSITQAIHTMHTTFREQDVLRIQQIGPDPYPLPTNR